MDFSMFTPSGSSLLSRRGGGRGPVHLSGGSAVRRMRRLVCLRCRSSLGCRSHRDDVDLFHRPGAGLRVKIPYDEYADYVASIKIDDSVKVGDVADILPSRMRDYILLRIKPFSDTGIMV